MANSVRKYFVDLWRSNRKFDRGIWVITAFSLLNSVGFSISLPFLSLYLYQKRGFDMTSIGAFILIGGLTSAAAQVLGGMLSDKLGRRPLLMSSIAASSLMYGGLAALVAVDGPVWAIILVWTVGRSVLVMGRPIVTAMITDLAPKERLTEAYGLLRVGQNLGWAIGPALGGYLVAFLSYSWLFGFAAFTSVLTFTLVLIFLRESFPGASQPVTYRSIVTTATRDRTFLIFIGICFLVFMVSGQMISTLSVFLVDKVGFSTTQYGLVLTLNGIIVILFQYPIARLIRNKIIGSLVLGSLLYGIGYLAMGWVNAFTGGMIAMAVVTAGEIIYSPTSQSVAGNLAPKDWRGRYMGLFALSETLGVSVGPLLGGVLLDKLPRSPHLLWGGITLVAFIAAIGFYYWGKLSPAAKEDRNCQQQT